MSELELQQQQFKGLFDNLSAMQAVILDGQVSKQHIDDIDLASHKISALRQQLSIPTEFLTHTQVPVVSADWEVFERIRQKGELGSRESWGVSGLGRIVKCKIHDVDSSKIESLTMLSQLEELTLDMMAGVDCSSLKLLEKLRSLSVSAAISMDYGFLTDLPALTALRVDHSPCSPGAEVSSLVNLEKLTFSTTAISDISFLKTLTRLAHLDISWNPVSNLDPLKCLSALESLFIRGLRPSNYGFLLELPALKRLTMSPIMAESLDAPQVIEVLKKNNVGITLI